MTTTFKSALISEDQKYRYQLERRWEAPLFDAKPGHVNWIMLNPSTADASVDDPTIRRVIEFTRRWGYSHMIVTNLYTFRTAYPAELAAAGWPTGPDNDRHIVEVAAGASLRIAAWGVNAQSSREYFVRLLLKPYRIHALKLTFNGSPSHPLYLAADTVPSIWKEAGQE